MAVWDFPPTGFTPSGSEYTGAYTTADEWPPAGGGTGERVQSTNAAASATRTGTWDCNMSTATAFNRGLMVVLVHTGTGGTGQWQVSLQLKVNGSNVGNPVIRTVISTATYLWSFFEWPASGDATTIATIMAAIAANPSTVQFVMVATNQGGATQQHRIDTFHAFVSPLSSVPTISGVTMSDFHAAWDLKAALAVDSSLWSDGGAVSHIPDLIAGSHMVRHSTNTATFDDDLSPLTAAAVLTPTTRWVTTLTQTYSDAWFIGVVRTGTTLPTGDTDSSVVMANFASAADGGGTSFNTMVPALAAASNGPMSWILMCAPTGAADDHIRATVANAPSTSTPYVYLARLASAANEQFWRKGSGEITTADEIIDGQGPSGTCSLRSISWGTRADNSRPWLGSLVALYVGKGSVSETTMFDYAQAIGVYHGILTNPSAAIVFDPVIVGESALDMDVRASGRAPLVFDMATEAHAAEDLVVVGGGSVPVSFDPASEADAAEDFGVSSQTPAQTLAFDPVTEGDSAPAGGGPTPWTFHNSGIAASADPTTVSFGYTAQAGELLYFLAGGAMTQITPSGWTKFAPAIGDLEVAVFRKVAAGGETSITVDHNGPRAMAWGFWAFPVGSTHVDQATFLDSGGTTRTLSGLPATSKVILAAYERVVASSQTTGAAATTWGGGVTELYESHLLGGASGTGGNDGLYQTVAYAQDYTGTSISPTATMTTTTGITGVNTYWLIWAVSVPASGDGLVVRASGGADIPLDGATEADAASDVLVRASGSADLTFDPVAEAESALDAVVSSGGAVGVPFDPVAEGESAVDTVLRASGGADIPFAGVVEGESATDTTVRASGAADLAFDPVAEGESATDTVVKGSGGADIPFAAVTEGEAAVDLILKGSGGVDLPFATVTEGESAGDAVVRASGAADIAFAAALSGELAVEFSVVRVGGNAVAFAGATEGDSAQDFSVAGGGTVVVGFAPATEGDSALGFSPRGSGAVVIPFDPVAARDLAAAFLVRASGGAVITLDPAVIGDHAEPVVVLGVVTGLIPVVTAGAGNVPIQWKDAAGEWQIVMTNVD